MEITLIGLDWIIGLSVLFGSLFFGLYMAKKNNVGQISANFFLGGRKMTWPIIGASLFATNIGAEHLVGLSGDSYRYGLSAGSVELTTFITLGFASAFLFPYYIKNKIFTIPEFLEIRYNRQARTFFSGLMLIISIMTKLAFTLFAGALVLNSLLGWNVMTTVFIIGVSVAVFTIIGGFTAVAYTDTIQTVIMMGGAFVMLYIGLDKVDGWSGLMAKAPEAMNVAKPYHDATYPFWGIIATAFYAGIFYWGIDQVNVQRILAAPNLKQARWGAMFAVFLKMFPIFIFALPGVIAFALFPGLEGGETRNTFVLLLNNLLPPGLRGLVLSSLIAALITSLIAVLNSVSTLVVRDFVLKYRPHLSDKKQISIGRMVILLATLLGIGAAYMVFKNEEGLYKYLQTITAYLVVPVFPAIFFGIISKKVTLTGAKVSVITGIVLSTIFVTDQFMGAQAGQKLFPFLHYDLTLNFGYRGLWATIFITAILFFVSSLTEKTSPDKLEHTTVNYSKLPEKFTGLSDWRLQLAVLSIITIFLYIFLS